MKNKLKEKLTNLGYALSYIEEKLNTWGAEIKEEKSWEGADDDVVVEKAEVPTGEVPKFFLNIGNVYENILLFDGEIHSIYKENILNDKIQFADYLVCNKLCLIGILKNKKIKVLYYEPNNNTIENHQNESYEMLIDSKRQALEQEYIDALSKKSQETIRKIINLLESEYILDYLIESNLNPRMKLVTNADNFATAITNYTHYYMHNNELKKIEKRIVPKILSNEVIIGNVTNNVFISVGETNHIADFPLNKLSYAWLSADISGKETLLIYTAEDNLSFSTYREYKANGDKATLKEIDKLQSEFSINAGYDISKEFLIKVFQKLNPALVFPPIDFIRRYGECKEDEEIKTFNYNYKAIFQKDEFEKELYTQLEESFTGKIKYTLVENIFGIYTKVGSKFINSDGNTDLENADFNIATNAAVLKRVTFVPNTMVDILKTRKELDEEIAEKLPMANVDVLFYFPALPDVSQEVKMYNGSTVENLFGELHNNEETIVNNTTNNVTDNKFYLEIKFVDESGNEINESVIKELHYGEKFMLDEFEYIVDSNENTWKCRNECKGNYILPENLSESTYILSYGMVTPNLKIIYNTITGKNLKEELIMTYTGEQYTVNDLPNLRDENGFLWKAQENANTTIFIEDNKINEIVIPYIEQKQKICIQYVDENKNKIGEDKVLYEQVGKNYKISAEKYYGDLNGCLWKMKECNPPTLKVSEKEENNLLVVTYEPECADVIIRYQDLNGEEIKNADTVKIQIGKQVNDILKKTIQDRRGNTWNIVMKDYKPFTVKRESVNEVIYQYDIAKSEVEIRFCSLDGMQIRPSVFENRQIGSGVVPTPDLFMYDEEERKWRLQKVEPALLKVKEKDNVITYWYQKALTEVTLVYVDASGNELQPPKKEKAQIGTNFTPETYEKTIYKSDQVLKIIDVRPEKILVKEDEQENRIQLVYQKDNSIG